MGPDNSWTQAQEAQFVAGINQIQKKYWSSYTALNYREEYTAYHDTCVRHWGPEERWTPEQQLAYLRGLQEIRDEQLAETERRYAPARYHPPPVSAQPTFEPLPKYHPPVATGPIQIKPDGRGGYTAWGPNGTTQQVERDGQGGYTIWGYDGTTHHVVPDRNGGWTIY
jgi:hypothetical protein